MKKISDFILCFVITVINFSCGEAADRTGAGAAHNDNKVPAEKHDNENTTSLTAEQIKSIGIEIGRIEQKQLTASLTANGTLRVPNQNKASISSVYNGIIKSLLVQPGDPVKKGAVIATIANPDFIVAQEEYLSIGSKITLAEQEYNRQKELNEGNAGALKNLQAAAANLHTLTTRKAALEQQIQLMGISPSSLSNNKLVSVLSLRSPINGIVSKVDVKMGTYVDLNTAVAEVVDNSQLHLDLFIYEKDLPKLKNNQSIHFTVTNNPGKEYDAEIYSLGSTFEDESKAVSVHARVKGDKAGLIDGMSITALISLSQITTPAVPNDAIVTSQGQDYIFVVTDAHNEAEHNSNDKGAHGHSTASYDHNEAAMTDNKETVFEKVPIVKGVSDVGYTQITLLKQVPAGATIITKGAFFVMAKLTNGGEGEHAH